MKALKYLIRKEFIEIRRTRSMIAITLGVPIIQLLILGMAITGDVVHVPTVITDLDNSSASRDLVSRLEHTRYLDVRRRAGDIREAEPYLQRNDAIIAVTIPQGFGKDIIRRTSPAIQILADAQNTNVALTGTGYVLRILDSWARSRGIPSPASSASRQIICLSNVRYNPELKSAPFMIPGIIVILVSVITVIMTALAIVRERGERGTFEQLLVTPVTRIDIILGKTIPFGIMGLIELSIALVVAKLVYHIPIAGSLPLFYGITLLFMATTLGIGILISTVTNTQQQALFAAWFILMFTLLLSGFFLPLENMPDFIYTITYLNPLRYYLTVVRELFLKGSGIRELWTQSLALFIIASVVLSAAVIRLNKRLG